MSLYLALAGESGADLFATLERLSDGFFWDNIALAWEVAPPDADSRIALTEGTGELASSFTATVDSLGDAGFIRIRVHDDADAADAVVTGGQTFVWGSEEVLPGDVRRINGGLTNANVATLRLKKLDVVNSDLGGVAINAEGSHNLAGQGLRVVSKNMPGISVDGIPGLRVDGDTGPAARFYGLGEASLVEICGVLGPVYLLGDPNTGSSAGIYIVAPGANSANPASSFGIKIESTGNNQNGIDIRADSDAIFLRSTGGGHALSLEGSATGNDLHFVTQKVTLPDEEVGPPRGLLQMIRRLWEGLHALRIRDRSTGIYRIRNEADDADLETATQTTVGEVDTQTKGE